MTLTLMGIIQEETPNKLYKGARDQDIDATIQKYCRSVKADKNSVDSDFERIEIRATQSIERTFKELLKIMNMRSTNNPLTKIFIRNVEMGQDLMTQLGINGVKRAFYARYYFAEPLDYRFFVGDIIKQLSDQLLKMVSKLEKGSFRFIAKSAINVSGVDVQRLIKELNMLFNIFTSRIERLIKYMMTVLIPDAALAKFVRPSGDIRCKNIVINVDESGIKLPPEKYYNPLVLVQTNPNYMINTTFNWDQFLSPYRSKLTSTIQSLA